MRIRPGGTKIAAREAGYIGRGLVTLFCYTSMLLVLNAINYSACVSHSENCVCYYSNLEG